MRPDELEKMYRLEDSYWWFVGRRKLVRELVRKYAPADARILDAGCGTGGTMDHLRALGSVTGADIAPEALEFCRERGHSALSQCRVEQLPFADASFDVVVSCDILEHLENDRGGLAELLRVLIPGGTVILTLPAYQWLWSEHDEALSHQRRYSARDLRARLEGLPARVLRMTYAVTAVFPVVLAVRAMSRLRVRPLGKPHTTLMSVPPWANRLLIGVQNAEAWWLQRAGLPFGTSLVAVLRKTV